MMKGFHASLSDVIYILNTLAGNPQPPAGEERWHRLDRDGNGRLDLPDALELLRLVGGL